MGHEKSRGAIGDQIVREIADAASVDPRSVWKRLAGGTLRRRAQERIDREIAARLGDEEAGGG